MFLNFWTEVNEWWYNQQPIYGTRPFVSLFFLFFVFFWDRVDVSTPLHLALLLFTIPSVVQVSSDRILYNPGCKSTRANTS